MSDEQLAQQIANDLSDCVDELMDLTIEELEALDFADPKRSYTSDFLTPSRDPRDSEIANGSASQQARVKRVMFDELRKEMANLKFTQSRSTGYAHVRSSGDWVEDETDMNVDQKLIDRTKNVDPGVFGTNEEHEEKDEAFEAAAQALKEAQDGGDIKQIVAELMSKHPELASNMMKTQTKHPVFRLGKLYSDELNQGSLNRGTTSTKYWADRYSK